MDSILSKISGEAVEALKEKDDIRVSTLRLLLAASHNRQIELGKELSDEDVLEVVAKSAKQHKESIAAYEAGGRQDLVDREKMELAILEKYLPQQLSEEEVSKIVVGVIDQTGALGASDAGKVIGTVMARVKGRVDGNIVSKIVREKLA